MKKSILKKQIRQLTKDKPLRMHMPGHKGKKRNTKLDVSEIEGADNLHNPQGVIKEVQDKIAEIYGADHCFLLVDGSTVGLQASILSSVGEGDKILIPTNAHRSVFPALSYSRAEPVYFKPEVTEESIIVTAEQIRDLIEEHPDVKAVLIVSPDYYGNLSDLKAIKQELKDKDIALIIDEAHGAHLKFLENCTNGISAGADYVIQSTHKILGAPTQGSILLLGSKPDARQVQRILAFLESSSPSYLLMSGIEEAVDEAKIKAESTFKRIYRAHDALSQSQNEDDPFYLVSPSENYDKSKFLFSYPKDYDIKKKLKELKVIPELVSDTHVLFMTGIGTSQRDLNRLFGTVKLINQDLKEKGYLPNSEKTPSMVLNENYKPEVPLYQVLGKSGKLVPLEESEGKIVLDFIVPYPPGVPYLIPGSRINQENVEALKDLVDNGNTVNGIIVKDKKIYIDILE